MAVSRTIAVVITLAMTAGFAGAQGPAGVTRRSVTRAPAVHQGSSVSFALEAAGGALGSVAGIAAVAAMSNCGVDDLKCGLLTIGAGGLAGAVGATIGTTLAARATGSPRSIPGAALGAVVGTAAGLGLHALLNAGTDRNLDDAIIVPIFALSQGVFAALGSRWLGDHSP
jgi:hypothetical protein